MTRSILIAALLSMAPLAPAAAVSSGAAQAVDADVEASARAMAELDAERLMTDRDYATQILTHVERLMATSPEGEQRTSLDSIQLIALTTLERREDAAALADRLLAQRPRDPAGYAGPIYAAMRFEDDARTVAVVEAASRNVPGVGWGELRELFDVDTMGSLLHQLRARHQDALRVRLAEALFRIGWPGTSELQSADALRIILVEDRLTRDDRTAAAEIAEGISTPGAILPMIVQSRFDQVLAPGRDRLELLREALVRQDRTTAESLAAAPDDPEKVLARVQYLRASGRDADALALIRPFSDDIPAAVASEEGMWLVNEAVYALIALGRTNEGAALMERLIALPLDQHPTLISMSINHIGILAESGRHAEALAHALRLQGQSDRFASDYGQMWIVSWIACSLSRLGRGAEAAPHLERLRAQAAANTSALTLAYVCMDDMAAAETLMIERLGGNDPGGAILAFQDYSLSRGVSQTGGLYDRLIALRERPAIRAAMARSGRILTLPLARTYWGNF